MPRWRLAPFANGESDRDGALGDQLAPRIVIGLQFSTLRQTIGLRSPDQAPWDDRLARVS